MTDTRNMCIELVELMGKVQLPKSPAVARQW